MPHPKMLNDALTGRGANNPEALARAQRNLAARRAGGQREKQPRRKPHKLTPQQERNREIRRGYGEDILRDHGRQMDKGQMDKDRQQGQRKGEQSARDAALRAIKRAEADKLKDEARELREIQMRGRQPSWEHEQRRRMKEAAAVARLGY